jgi:diguanylate cyclase (GGDEF)-like protein
MVLQALGALLQRNSRSCDIACRYGGEEFLLILPDTSLAAAAQRADEFLKQIRRLRLTHQNSSFQITASIGVAVFPEHAREQEKLIRAADEALYRAKERGRDQAQSAIF